MRLRVCVVTCALAMLGGFAAAGTASAASPQTHRLTIAAAPDPVSAGNAVLIYGQLFGPGNAGQTIRLYHHVIGSHLGYTFVTTTTTDSLGRYELVRPEGLIYSNRNWFAKSPYGSRSRVVHERVTPLVSISASTASTDTNRTIVFTGHVTPNHRFAQVFLQQQIGASDDWRTLRATTLGPGSTYFFAHRWRRPGVHDVRVLFKGDARNVRGASDPVTVNIEQAQVPGFTISSSSPIVASGGSVTISGVLAQRGSRHSAVQLWGRAPRHPFVLLATEPTTSNGSYSFTQSNLTTNMIYVVTTMPVRHAKGRHSAVLYQGVRDVVTMSSSTGSANSDQTVTFTGTVSPDKTGHVIYLETLGNDGDYHVAAIGIVRPGSKFQFTWRLGAPGNYQFRARITSDRDNIGSASTPPVTVTATPQSTAGLPPAS